MWHGTEEWLLWLNMSIPSPAPAVLVLWFPTRLSTQVTHPHLTTSPGHMYCTHAHLHGIEISYQNTLYSDFGWCRTLPCRLEVGTVHTYVPTRLHTYILFRMKYDNELVALFRGNSVRDYGNYICLATLHLVETFIKYGQSKLRHIPICLIGCRFQPAAKNFTLNIGIFEFKNSS